MIEPYFPPNNRRFFPIVGKWWCSECIALGVSKQLVEWQAVLISTTRTNGVFGEQKSPKQTKGLLRVRRGGFHSNWIDHIHNKFPGYVGRT